MITDERGLALTTESAAAARHFDTVVTHYVKYKADTASWIPKMLEADPAFVLGQVLKGYLIMTAFDRRRLDAAGEALAAARRAAAKVTRRELMHIAALDAWHRGALDDALRIWGEILAAYPLDMLAARLAHFLHFWLGNSRAIRDTVEKPLQAWSDSMPGYGSMQAMLAFGLEECGEYAPAERAALKSLECDRAELWGTHARAHVMEMQGRHREGIDWLKGEEPYWAGGSNMLHHLWWHRSMFHLELGETDAVLERYDHGFRDLASPLVKAMPDLYIDVQNAASMLWRLEQAGVAVGDRWIELADKAMARMGDVQNLFTVPHFMMALAAAGRREAARRFLEALGEAAAGSGSTASVLREVVIPLCAAVLAHREGEHAKVVALLEPIRGRIIEIGGSHAQRDMFTQLLLDSAVKAGCTELARAILDTEAKARPIPVAQRSGYAAAARQLLN
jgi:tetratricopeptide (TPR) repeat protein